jgi:hypothetical protein
MGLLWKLEWNYVSLINYENKYKKHINNRDNGNFDNNVDYFGSKKRG